MNKKSFIFWSIFVALAVLRLWQSSTDTRISSDKCLKQHITGTGKIISEPEKKETGQVFVIFADHFSMIEASEICGEEVAIRVKTKLYPSFSFGDQVSFSGKLLEPTNFENADGRVFDYVGYLEKDDIYFEIKSANVRRLGRTDTQLSLSDHFKINNLSDSISSQLFTIKKLLFTV